MDGGSSSRFPWPARGLAIIMACAALGAWTAPREDDPAPSLSTLSSQQPPWQPVATRDNTAQRLAAQQTAAEIQKLLAQAGCAGWSEVPIDGQVEPLEATSTPAGGPPGGPTRSAAGSAAPGTLPRVDYPVPLRIASRVEPNQPSGNAGGDALLGADEDFGWDDLRLLPAQPASSAATGANPSAGETATETVGIQPAPVGAAEKAEHDDLASDALLTEEDDLLPSAVEQPRDATPWLASPPGPSADVPPPAWETTEAVETGGSSAPLGAGAAVRDSLAGDDDALLDEGEDALLGSGADTLLDDEGILPTPVEPATQASGAPVTKPAEDALFTPPGPARPSSGGTEAPVAPESPAQEGAGVAESAAPEDIERPAGARVSPPTPQPGAPQVAPPSLPAPHSTGGSAGGPSNGKSQGSDDAQSRCEFVAKTLYPSALECRTCHEKIYEEWSVSSHAYAFVSPMFHKFEQRLQELTQGTIGYFCYRCHTPVGTSLGIDRTVPYWQMPQAAREGVTCVVCHRVRENYGKSNGERRIEPGDITAPVYGSIGGAGIAEAIANKEKYKFKTSPDEEGPGQLIHLQGVGMPQLAKSEFCASCHQVAVYPGIKLEVVWEQYRASPACKKGVRCQDCHMGRIPGVPSGFEVGAAAEFNKQSVNNERKHSNHVFWGPGYSIAHPGVFPFNPKANRWTVEEWLQFDWRAGWGTEAFEDAVDDGVVRAVFPKVWSEADDRMDAREVLDDNLKKKAFKDTSRRHVMENGSHIEGPFFENPPTAGADLRLHYVVINRNDGHHLITASLGAQPQLWANVALIGPRGQRLWETGYLDSLGDLADIHSEDVRNKRLEFDWQLFNLQTMFLITGVKGADREFPLPVNFSIDQLPFIRPGVQPIPNINHPPFIRMEMRSIAPLGSRKVPYRIPGHLLCEPGTYRLSFRMRSRLEPPYFMRFCRTTPDMVQAMNEGILNFHEFSYEFVVSPAAATATRPVLRRDF